MQAIGPIRKCLRTVAGYDEHFAVRIADDIREHDVTSAPQALTVGDIDELLLCSPRRCSLEGNDGKRGRPSTEVVENLGGRPERDAQRILTGG